MAGSTTNSNIKGATNVKITGRSWLKLKITSTKIIAITGGNNKISIEKPKTVVIYYGKGDILTDDSGEEMISGG